MRPATLCLRKIFFGQTVSTHRLARGQAFPDHALRSLGLLAGALVLFAALAPPARAQSAVTRDDIVNQLNHFDAAPDLDVAALREQVLKRSQSRSRNEPPPQKRAPIAPELAKLPSFNVDIQFDTDTPIVQPASYQTLGRIADALVQSTLLPYTFLIVGHIEGNGRRENNAILSQRRADAIRDVLVNTFKISSKRLQSVGLGEEQLLDAAHPTAPVNQQVQIMTVAKIAEQAAQPSTAPNAPSPAKKSARKAHR
jgi:outer membrane protein OmpA-like peptidoglycan-associated protein